MTWTAARPTIQTGTAAELGTCYKVPKPAWYPSVHNRPHEGRHWRKEPDDYRAVYGGYRLAGRTSHCACENDGFESHYSPLRRIEAGYFVGAKKKLHILLVETVEPELMYRMGDGIHVGIDSLLSAIKPS